MNNGEEIKLFTCVLPSGFYPDGGPLNLLPGDDFLFSLEPRFSEIKRRRPIALRRKDQNLLNLQGGGKGGGDESDRNTVDFQPDSLENALHESVTSRLARSP